LASPARIRSTLATITAPPHELGELKAFHRALADVSRLRIIQRLAESPATVTELIEHVGLSQPLVSWHVRTLRQTGLVQTRRSGREVICSLRPEQFAAYRRREADLLGTLA
jgi:DNA-binding transcriptional ArsR family regulator